MSTAFIVIVGLCVSLHIAYTVCVVALLFTAGANPLYEEFALYCVPDTLPGAHLLNAYPLLLYPLAASVNVGALTFAPTFAPPLKNPQL